MNKKNATELLYSMWENGHLPSNFTEDHSDYGAAIKYAMKHGHFDYNKFQNR